MSSVPWIIQICGHSDEEFVRPKRHGSHSGAQATRTRAESPAAERGRWHRKFLCRSAEPTSAGRSCTGPMGEARSEIAPGVRRAGTPQIMADSAYEYLANFWQNGF